MKNRPWSFQRGDWIAVALILALVLTAGLWLPELRSGGSFAQVWQDGKLVREVPLSVDQSFQIHGDYTNTVTVSDGKIAVTHSDCPTKDCVHMGWLHDGGTIVCLPNRVEIRLTGTTDVDFVVQ